MTAKHDSFGFFDATCTKCHKRFGWSGRLSDKPACPKCGQRDPPPTIDIRPPKATGDQGLFDGRRGNDPQAWAHI